MMAAVVLVGCGEKPASSTPKSEPKIPAPSQAAEARVQATPTPSPDPVSPADEKLIVGKPIHMSLAELEGKLTEAKVTPEPTPEAGPVSPADEKLIADPIVEKAVRKSLKKPEGELTEADLVKVTKLILTLTQITDAGLKDVAKLEKLKYLDLAFTKTTDEGLREVAKLQKLEVLWLRGTKVTKAGVAELKKALPNCEIYGLRFNAEDITTTTAESSKKFTEKDVVGTYQMNLPNGLFTMTLLKDGKSILVHTTNAGEKKPETGKWKIEDGNLFLIGNDETGIMKINPDRSLSPIAEIKNGLREDWDPKITSVVSFKKIK